MAPIRRGLFPRRISSCLALAHLLTVDGIREALVHYHVDVIFIQRKVALPGELLLLSACAAALLAELLVAGLAALRAILVACPMPDSATCTAPRALFLFIYMLLSLLERDLSFEEAARSDFWVSFKLRLAC